MTEVVVGLRYLETQYRVGWDLWHALALDLAAERDYDGLTNLLVAWQNRLVPRASY